MLLNIMAFYLCHWQEDLFDFKLTQIDRAPFMVYCKRIWKIFYKINNDIKKNSNCIDYILRNKRIFVTRNIKNVSSKGHYFFIMCYPAAYDDLHEFMSIMKMQYMSRMHYVVWSYLKVFIDCLVLSPRDLRSMHKNKH